MEKTAQETQWLGLKVLKAGKDQTNENIGYVEFAAFYKNTMVGQLHENSKNAMGNERPYQYQSTGSFIMNLVPFPKTDSTSISPL